MTLREEHAYSLADLDARVRELELARPRHDATSSSVDALAHQGVTFAEFVAEQRRHNAATRRELATVTRLLQRATATPVAFVAFLISGEAGASTTGTLGVTAATLVVAFLYPETVGRVFGRAAELAAPKGNGSSGNGGASNGNGAH